MTSAAPFLTAEWRHVAMVNFEVDPALLRPLIPDGTELDTWEGRHFASVVGFLFLKARALGMPIPFHQKFEEVNLRFYVRRFHDGQWRRGVVFVREYVPCAAVTLVARHLYGEHYSTLPMTHHVQAVPGGAPGQLAVGYTCRSRVRESRMTLSAQGAPSIPAPGSSAEFIAEHYWGYTRRGAGRTSEYRVEHPQWRVAPATVTAFDWDAHGLYGPEFSACLSAPPASAFIAEGSPVSVFRGTTLPVTQGQPCSS